MVSAKRWDDGLEEEMRAKVPEGVTTGPAFDGLVAVLIPGTLVEDLAEQAKPAIDMLHKVRVALIQKGESQASLKVDAVFKLLAEGVKSLLEARLAMVKLVMDEDVTKAIFDL